MRYTFMALTFLAALSAPSARAQSFDPGQCTRIQDVDLPYEVAMTPESITFSSRVGDIVVSAQSISAGGRTHASPNVAMYHQGLTQFLAQAEIMAGVARGALNPFARRDASLGDAATGMCQAIVELAGSAALIEGEFNGYSSPVRIQLR